MSSKIGLHRVGKTAATVASILLAAVATVPAAYAQSQVRINPEIKHDVSPPLRDLAPKINPEPHPELDIHRIPRPYALDLPDGALQRTHAPIRLSPAPGASFDGLGQGFPGFNVQYAPSDNNLSVGPNHIIDIVNVSFVILSKTGTVILAPRPINTLWTGFGGGCESNNDGDPVVKYDAIANRWVIAQFSVGTTPYLQCVAVSTSPDPTGTYNRYSFNYGNVDFNDYPKMSVWPDAYYTTYNLFANQQNFIGADSCAFDRTAMLAGQAATQQCFMTGPNYGGVLPSDVDGATLPPAGSPNYQVALGIDNSHLAFWKFHVDFTTPANSTFTGPASIAVAGFTPACGGGGCIPQKNTSQVLDSLADRVMYRFAYRNYGDHEALFVNHAVTANGGVGERWYELRNPSTTPTVYQQGTFAPDAKYRWMGSIAADNVGNIAMGYSLSSSSDFPTIKYTGRIPTDTLGTLETETTLIAGTGSQTSGLARWGDYSSTAIDPSDDCTFWYTNEYIHNSGSFNWSTRIGSFKFPTCGGVQNPDFSFGATPSTLTLAQGASGNYTATATSVNGFSGNVTGTISGLPTGAQATFTPNPIVVPNNGSGNSTVNISTLSTTPTGSYPLTITGTSGSLVHTASVSLVVTATGGGSVSVSPTSINFGNGYIGATGSTYSVTVKNTGTTPVTVSGATTAAPFSATTTCSTLNPGAICRIVVTFTPTTTGTQTGTLTITDTATNSPQTVALTGKGNSSLYLYPASLNFGTVTVGTTSAAKTMTVSNNQHVAVAINGITVTGDYAQTGGTCPSGPSNLAARTSCTVQIKFTPTGTGARPGSVAVSDNAPDSPLHITLNGTGR